MEIIPASSQTGNQPSVHPDQQAPGVTYVLNGVAQAGAGGSYLWSREPANQLAFSFPAGFTFVGSVLLTELGQTLLFSGGTVSEIGVVYHKFAPIDYAATIPPVAPAGTYLTLLRAPCLQFNPAYPLSIEYQYKGTDLYLYLADHLNPDRLIRFTVGADNRLSLHPDSLTISGVGSCNEPLYGTTLSCDRCRLDPLISPLSLKIRSTQTGGVWEAGTLQIRAAFCTPTGERLTEFFASSGSVSIWETALSTRAGVPTGVSVTLDLQVSSDRYTHVQLAILQTIGSQVTTFTLDPISSTTTSLVLRGNEPRLPLSLGELLETRTHYEHSQGLTQADNRLLRWGLVEKPVFNLQPYLLSIPVTWQTIQLPEGAYKDGVIAGRFRGYMRDEIVALGVVFEYRDGDESGVYHLAGRRSTVADVQIDGQGRIKWQNGETASQPTRWGIPYTSADNPGLWESGTMGYWESTERYPNRPDIWGSLCGQPIRHHKLPSSSITHIHSGYSPSGVVTSKPEAAAFIYPLGLQVSVPSLEQAIRQAENGGIIPPGIITGYRIVRADRTGQASVLSRGLLYQMNRYTHKTKKIFFPNYPFNDVRPDPMLSADPDSFAHFTDPVVPLDFINTGRYTFHSPDIHFTQPGRGNTIQVEVEEFGVCQGQYSLCEDQAKLKLETEKIRNLSLLAGMSEAASFWDNFGGPPDPVLRFLKALSFSLPFLELLRHSVPYVNYAVQFQAVGWYNQYKNLNPGFIFPSPTRLPILQQAMLQPDIQQVGSTVINNRFRERSLYIETSEPLLEPGVQDMSRWKLSEAGELDKPLIKPISAQYATVKADRPAQYGRIDTILYLETAARQTRLTTANTLSVWGGDTFINRFSVKRKHSYFTQSRFKLADGSSVNYSQIPNVAYPAFYVNTEAGVFGDASKFLPLAGMSLTQFEGQTGQRLDLDTSTAFQKKGYMYLYSYGIPYFFCESAVNLDMRQADNLLEAGFYPLVDPQSWTQENQVSPQADNVYSYDLTYSRPVRENRLLAYPESQLYNQRADQQHPNRVIYSEPGNFRYFKALNSHDFEQDKGNLTGLTGLDANRVLARFDHGSALFNAYVTVQTGAEVAQIGNGGMFASRPQWFAQAEGGLLGSQQPEICATPYGHVWVDQIRGSVYLIPPNGAPQPIHEGAMQLWLREHLPAQLEAQLGLPLPAVYKPLELLYDRDNDRLLLLKRDYLLTDGAVTFNPANRLFSRGTTSIPYGDPRYFRNVGWTLSFHFPTKAWAYHQLPVRQLLPLTRGYISLTATDGWLHQTQRKWFNRICNQDVPFKLGIWTGTQPKAVTLQSLAWNTDVRLYQSADNHAQIDGVPYDSLTVSSDRQRSAQIPLVPRSKNRMRDLIRQGPQLFQQPGGVWSISQLVDTTQAGTTQPLWLIDIDRLPNPAAQRVGQPIKIESSLKGTGFYCQFTITGKPQYQFIHRWTQPTLTP